jgi:hypothetical protein
MARKKTVVVAAVPVRRCANVKSKKHPDVQCQLAATQGEFCARHAKNPVRFKEHILLRDSRLDIQEKAATRLQGWWRRAIKLRRWNQQGPAANDPTLAENQEDLYTLDPVSTIPVLYRWSYADHRKHIWVFDVRSFSMLRAEDARDTLLNPYTREAVPESSATKFQERCKTLRAKKYCLVHSSDAEMTAEQQWHQKVLDVVQKYDMLGYHTCISWFEDLQPTALALFYTELWELWNYRLQLSTHIKNQVVPGWNKVDTLLFKWLPTEVRNRREKKWWQKVMLEMLDRLVSAGQVKEQKILGALYAMTAFAIVSPTVRGAYPWLVEMPGDEEY